MNIQGGPKKLDHFWKYVTPVYDDTGRRSIYQNVQLFIAVIRNIAAFKYFCTSSEKRYYTENTNYFKHDVRLLYTIPSKLTNIADYEHQLVSSNSTCLLCTLNTIAALFSSRFGFGTPFIASHLPDPAV